MVNKRNSRKQMWANKDFVDVLEKVKAKRILNNDPVKSITDLTKEMLEMPSFHKLLDEMSNKQININIRFDKKKIW